MRLFGAVLAVALGMSMGLRADDNKSSVSPEIAGWVEKLGDPSSTVRDEAVKKLVEIGGPAIEPVAAATDSESLEKQTRCISVLAELRKSKEPAVKSAAERALKQLAESDNKSVARRAQSAAGLRKPSASPIQARPGIVINRVAVNGQINGRVSTRNVNGDIEVEATENNKEIKISKKATGEISMVVNETDANGKVTGSRFTARDVEELKKNHPDAAKVFEKYMAAQPRMNVVVNGGVLQLGAINRVPAFINPLEIQRTVEDLAKAREDLSKIGEKLKALAKDPNGKLADLETVVKELEAASSRVDEAQKRLGTVVPGARLPEERP